MPLPEVLRRHDIDEVTHRDAEVITWLADRVEPAAWAWFDPVVRGLEHIPAGAALYVGNHSGGLLTPDTFVFGIALLRQRGLEHVPFGLAHETVMKLPGFHQLLMAIGAVRASAQNARALFAAGKKVLVYPGGDLDAMRSFRARDRIVFGPRRGYVRLALREGVPIVPVVAAGGHSTYVVLDDGRWLAEALGLDRRLRIKVWPISLSIPWGLTIGPAPPHFPLRSQIFIEALPPITFERAGPAAAEDEAYVESCHHRVLTVMETALARLVEERRAAKAARRTRR